MKQIYQNKQSQFEADMKRARESFSRESEELRGQLEQQEGKMKDYENKIGMLVCETERLNGLLRSKLEEVEMMKGRCRKMEEEHKKSLQWREQEVRREQEGALQQVQNKSVLLASEVDRLNQVLKEKVGELEEGRKRALECERLEKNNQELQNRIGLISSEIERLNSILKQKVGELEEANRRAKGLAS